jgi:hypothetical protein
MHEFVRCRCGLFMERLSSKNSPTPEIKFYSKGDIEAKTASQGSL